MRTLMLLLSALALTGCVSEKTAMVNQQGKVVHCDAWGFGWLGAPVAMAQHHNCVKNAQAARVYGGWRPCRDIRASISVTALGRRLF